MKTKTKTRLAQASLFPLCAILGNITKQDFGDHGINNNLELLTKYYAADVLAPLGVTSLILSTFSKRSDGTRGSLTYLTLLCVGEFNQKYDFLWQSERTYDPYDFLAYGIGFTLAYILDKKRRELNNHSLPQLL